MLVGSGLGIAFGLLIAAGAEAAIRSLLGTDIGSDLPLHPTTIALSVLVGVLVTVIAAVLPARRASRVAPVAAMRGDAGSVAGGLGKRGTDRPRPCWSQVPWSSVARSPALTSPWPVAGLGAIAAVLGMLVGAPLATRPVVRVIAWPFVAVMGAVGRLARENALRVPRRTAATASALMIGLALVAGISVLAQSVKASVSDGVANELTSDFVLNSGNIAPVPAPWPTPHERYPGFASVAAISHSPYGSGLPHDRVRRRSPPTSPTTSWSTMHRGQLSCPPADAPSSIDQTTANARRLEGGRHPDREPSARWPSEPLVVGGIYEDSQAFGRT